MRSEREARALHRAYEPLPVPEGELGLSELVEDELILALPMAALHEDERLCETKGEMTASPPGDSGSDVEKRGPFAVLTTLLKKSDNQEC